MRPNKILYSYGIYSSGRAKNTLCTATSKESENK